MLLFAQQAHAKGLELVCDMPEDLPIAVRGDPVRLRQVATNLVSNAVKFTEKGEIVLMLRLAVGDRGLGARQLRDPRHRYRHTGGCARAHLRGVHAGRQLDDASLRRHRPRARHRETTHRDDGRNARIRQCTGAGHDVPVRARAAEAGRVGAQGLRPRRAARRSARACRRRQSDQPRNPVASARRVARGSRGLRQRRGGPASSTRSRGRRSGRSSSHCSTITCRA